MVVIGIILGLVILFFIIKIVRTSTPKGFAKGLAKAQLVSFFSLRSKYPDMKPVELYLASLKLRPGYDEERVLAIVDKAKMAHEKNGTPFNFQEVVVWMAVKEYQDRTGESFAAAYIKVREPVVAIIPSNL